MEKKEKKLKRFRLRGLHLFCTYAKISKSREEVLSELTEKLLPRKVVYYVIATEKHKSGEEHVHVYLRLDKICDILSKSRLDLTTTDGKVVHGNYQSCRSWGSVIKYVVKEGLSEVLTNMDLTSDGREKSVWGDAIALAEQGKIKESLDLVKGRAQALYYKEYKRLKANAQEIKADSTKSAVTVYAVKTFDMPEKIQKWLDTELDKLALFVSGSTGSGKTECVKSILSARYGAENVLRVTNWEGLRKLGEREYKAIIFDDVNMDEKTAEDKIGVVDVANDSDHRILYGTVTIPAKMPRVIVSNKDVEEYFGECRGRKIPQNQMAAILRRIRNVPLGNKRLIIRQINEVEVFEGARG